jgi:UDP-N-acetylglucosamine acyltransferase
MTTIHPTAVVAPDAILGTGVTVGPYAVIEGDVRIGDGTVVDAGAQIKRFTTLGAGNHVHSMACVGGEPQDLKFHGEETRLEIGDRNRIREFSTIHRGTEGGGG